MTNECYEKMTYFESKMTKSETAEKYGIDNSPSTEDKQRISNTVLCIILPLYYVIGNHFFISSGYRSDALNKVVGGVSNSQHKTGEAVDIVFENDMVMSEAASFIAKAINFDQLILYKNFIHISVKYIGKQRNEIIIKSPSLAAKMID